ncbi:MCE family protein [Mycobacteroides abscessus]
MVRVVPVLAMVAVICGVGALWPTQHRRYITVTAQFDSAAGLYPGSTVAVLGMRVGSVEKITPEGGYVEVEFTVDRQVALPADVQAVTISTSILTDRQIELTPPYRGGAVMHDNETIGLNRTKTPVEFSRVVAVLDKLSISLRGDGEGGGSVADIVNTGADAVDGNGQKIKGALDELSRALRLGADGGRVTAEQLATVIKNVGTLMDAAARNDSKLREFTSTIHQLSQIVDDESLGTGSVGRKLNDVLKQAAEVLETNRDHIKQSVLNGDGAFKTLVDQQRELTELVDVLPLALDNLYNIIDQDNGAVRTRAMVDHILFDSQHIKEICNLMGLRQLGCSTGTMKDFGPDFGLTYILDGLAAMGQK